MVFCRIGIYPLLEAHVGLMNTSGLEEMRSGLPGLEGCDAQNLRHNLSLLLVFSSRVFYFLFL